MRILLLLVVAGGAIGIAGALFSGRETVAGEPVVAGSAPSPAAAAPAAGTSPDGGTPDVGRILEQDSAVEGAAATAADSDEAAAGGSDPRLRRAATNDASASPTRRPPRHPPTQAAAPRRLTTRGTRTPGNEPTADAGTVPAPASSGGEGDAGAPAPGADQAPAAATADESDDADAAAELLESLRPLVASPDPDVPDYDRDHFAGWLDDDGDCVNTRHEILQAEAVDFSMNAAGCAVESGEWFDPYTNRTFTNPRDLDVDHVVALADAWVSGAWAWADELLDNFSNDFGNLNAIAAGENRSKSARGPAGYSPTAAEARCDYLVQYATVKIRWELSITPQDFDVVATGLTGCEVGNIPDASPVARVAPPAAPDASAAESATTTNTTQVATDCHPAYEPCLPNLPGDAMNCGDLGPDQRPVTVLVPGVDPYRLDRDGDGRGCTS